LGQPLPVSTKLSSIPTLPYDLNVFLLPCCYSLERHHHVRPLTLLLHILSRRAVLLTDPAPSAAVTPTPVTDRPSKRVPLHPCYALVRPVLHHLMPSATRPPLRPSQPSIIPRIIPLTPAATPRSSLAAHPASPEPSFRTSCNQPFPHRCTPPACRPSSRLSALADTRRLSETCLLPTHPSRRSSASSPPPPYPVHQNHRINSLASSSASPALLCVVDHAPRHPHVHCVDDPR
jgi:hypothetical protein